jgi:hypothetical protein
MRGILFGGVSSIRGARGYFKYLEDKKGQTPHEGRGVTTNGILYGADLGEPPYDGKNSLC